MAEAGINISGYLRVQAVEPGLDTGWHVAVVGKSHQHSAIVVLSEHDEHDSALKFPTISGKAGVFIFTKGVP